MGGKPLEAERGRRVCAGAERETRVDAQQHVVVASRATALVRHHQSPETHGRKPLPPGLRPVLVGEEVDVEGQLRQRVQVRVGRQQGFQPDASPQRRFLQRRFKYRARAGFARQQRDGQRARFVQAVGDAVGLFGAGCKAKAQPGHRCGRKKRGSPLGRSQRMRNRPVPVSMAWPSCSNTSATAPARSLLTWFIIFMLSMMHSTSPMATVSPTATKGCSPGAGAR